MANMIHESESAGDLSGFFTAQQKEGEKSFKRSQIRHSLFVSTPQARLQP